MKKVLTTFIVRSSRWEGSAGDGTGLDESPRSSDALDDELANVIRTEGLKSQSCN